MDFRNGVFKENQILISLKTLKNNFFSEYHLSLKQVIFMIIFNFIILATF